MKILVSINSPPNTQQVLRYAVARAKSLARDTTEWQRISVELLILNMYHVPIGGDTVFFASSPNAYHFIGDKLPTRGIQQHLMRPSADLLVMVHRHHVVLGCILAIHLPLPILFTFE